ncbi:MAG: hypothetical protein II669_06285, partial [Elusimicrobia bacterium]|nr:hypothetical protein [Elusimicrobiota bacterium]
KKILSLLLLCSIFMGCTSAKLISSKTIPSEKETVYISFDNTQATVSTGGFVVGNIFLQELIQLLLTHWKTECLQKPC